MSKLFTQLFQLVKFKISEYAFKCSKIYISMYLSLLIFYLKNSFLVFLIKSSVGCKASLALLKEA